MALRRGLERPQTMTVQRMDNVLIVVDDLDAAIAFFVELGMELEGRMPIEGPWVDRTIGIDGTGRRSRRCEPRRPWPDRAGQVLCAGG